MTPPESLTESERERIGRVATCELENSADEAEARANAVAKLLRIHDRLQGEVREMAAALEPSFRPVQLHQGLDLLLAQFLADQDNIAKLPSNTTVMELLVWSHARARKATI